MSKIAAGIIVKDDSEAEILSRALNTISGAVDKIFITSTQKPYNKIKKICKKFDADWSWFPWTKDFSEARNFNFSQVPKEYEWIFWMDADDAVLGAENFKSAVAKAERINAAAVYARYLYQVELDKDNNIKEIIIEHLRERLVRNNGKFKWIGAIHETLIEQVPQGATDSKDFQVVHLASQKELEGSMWRNIDILEEEVLRKIDDPRPIYYLAKAYFDTREPMIIHDSVGQGLGSYTMEMLKNYIRSSGWSEERAQAYEYVAMLHREKGEMNKALAALLEAAAESPKFPSIYIQLALTYVMMKDWAKALHWAKVASHIELPKTTLVIQPRDYKSMILECLYHVYVNTGQLDDSLKVAEALYNILPNDTTKQRLKDIADVKHKNDMAHWIVKLAYHLNKTNQQTELQYLVNAIPREIAAEPVLVNLRNNFIPPRKWQSDEIAIYCGPGFEKWSPKSVASGLGGSEEAVIHMAEELTKLGWYVVIYGDPEVPGMYNGVNYMPYYTVNWNDDFNILVSWRQIGLFDLPIKAKKTYLWNHDLQNPLLYTDERVSKITKVMFLSKFHRSNVPGLSENNVMLTSNGI